MQCWRLEHAGRTLFGFADLVPMRAHVPLAWIMGYDLFLWKRWGKKETAAAAAREGWGCLSITSPMPRFKGRRGRRKVANSRI